jgi:RNA recognition motif-containing protein
LFLAPVDPALVERYCVKLGNLHEKETEETVKALCVANLPLHTILAVRRLEKWPRLAFVDLATHDAATKLIQALNKKSVNGRVINVETSTSNKPVASRDTFLQSPTDAKTASDTLATLPPPPDGTTPTSEIPKVRKISSYFR